jgi:hypothetical protein
MTSRFLIIQIKSKDDRKDDQGGCAGLQGIFVTEVEYFFGSSALTSFQPTLSVVVAQNPAGQY